jgi:hypothetical protein
VTSALHQFDKAAAQFQSDQPWTKQANWVDFDLLGEEAARQFSAFERLGKDHLMGIRMLNGTGRPNVMYGLRSGRPEVMDIVQPGKAIGFVPAGAAHHLTQDYGWWHVNDADEIYIPVPLTNGVLAFVILEATFANRWDKFQWYCLDCFTFLHERRVHTGRVGMQGYWEAEAAAVTEFNADLERRTCPNCQTVHPLAYSFWEPGKEDLW